jgi:hypothetical protein
MPPLRTVYNEDMSRIIFGKIASIVLASSCLYGVSLVNRTECFAAAVGDAIRIVFPLPGDVLPAWQTIVKGELNIPTGMEVGVKVNGAVALISGAKFATIVPLNFPTPTTEISATVTDARGTVLGRHSIPLTAEPPRGDLPLTWRAFPPLGVAPLSVRFTATSVKQLARAELDLDGDGAIDWRGAKLERLEFELSRPGLYFPTLTVTDTDGKSYSETVLVQVIDQKELDALLQTKWKAMKDALRQDDVNKATDYIIISRRDGYRKMFEALTIPLSEIDKVLTDIKFVKLSGVNAEYEMLYSKNGQKMSGLVNFRLDEDGIWRIRFF